MEKRPKHPYELPYRNMFDNDVINGSRKPVQSRSWACDEYSGRFFIDDIDNPYEGSDHFTWIRAASVGGRMNVWGRQVYRYSQQDFNSSTMRGYAERWPIDYSDLESYYDEVERFIGVSGTLENISNLPDGKFLPSMPLTEGESHFKRSVEARWPKRKVIPGRTATLTQQHEGRHACVGSGHCYRGCASGSFFEPLGTTLSAAQKTGRLSLLANAHVAKIEVDAVTGSATGVQYVKSDGGAPISVRARAVVLAASTIASTRIMLSSALPGLPNGIGSSSGRLGQYLHGHLHSVMCSGDVPWLLRPVGHHDEGRPNYMHIPQFVNCEGDTSQESYVGGFGIEGAVKHYMYPRNLVSRGGFGVAYKQSVRNDPVCASFFLTAFGTMIPQARNSVTLSDTPDKFGLRTVKVDFSYNENDMAMAEAMHKSVTEMADEAGFDIRFTNNRLGSPGMCVHEVGTARMGMSRSTSVLDPWNRVWDVNNVIVVDGACFPSSGPQNPTLTMMAVALRASRQLSKDLTQKSVFKISNRL